MMDETDELITAAIDARMRLREARRAYDAIKRRFIEPNRKLARRRLVLTARRALLEALERKPTATADDVAAAVQIPEGIDRRLLGSVPGELARAGLIEADGYSRSARRSRRASVQTRWRLVNPEAAAAWLAANPAEPTATTPTNDERPTAATAGRSKFPSNQNPV
jgi:hypothetical protein